MTDITIYDEASLKSTGQLANQLSKSSLAGHFRNKPDDAFSAILLGA
jgi:hypothetical protein